MILIPDVHGRSFWKEAVKEAIKTGESVVFLGDYLDHYYGEVDAVTKQPIKENAVINQFKEIIELARNNKNITLLLGNHDTEYFLQTPACRMYEWQMQEIQKLFEDNIELFKVAFYREINGKTYTFSHTCLTEGWVKMNKDTFGENPSITQVIDTISTLSLTQLSDLLGQVGFSRGGYSKFGSLVWADMSDMDIDDWTNEDRPVIQIFGHTQQSVYPVFEDNFAMLDCRQAFRLDEETGNITCITKPNPVFGKKYDEKKEE